ncbi:MAG TPA: ABC transporter permease [bacterium]|nr:ABC transporter permease [bacterium]HPN45426.1 ABC transporter permease [bacterium]
MYKKTKKSLTELGESIKIALTSLAANKMRAALTMLGIIIGVAAVITVVGLGNGAQKAITDRIQSLGSNLLFVRAGSPNQGHIHWGEGSSQSLENIDAEVIKEKSTMAAYVIPEFSKNAQIVYGAKNWNSSVVGTIPEFEAARSFKTTDGRYFTAKEMENSERVAVIGNEVKNNLFGSTNPIGETIKINQDNFIVVGLLEKKGQTGWRNEDDQILIPITTAQKRVFGADYLTGITIQVLNDKVVDEALVEIEKILRRQHRLLRDQDNDFSIRNQSDVITTFQETNKSFSFLLASIAGVSLLVGGIGIMNIMLVSVTERTREIGIRKAIGARRKDILLQFLIESVTISLAGGVLGILLGILLSYGLATWAQWNTMVSAASIIMSFAFASAVGLFFGIYPARKAASLDPIIALRYE